MRSTAAFLAACLMTLGCAAAPAPAGALSAQEAWIRATPGSAVAAAYLTLHNGSTQPVVVVGVRSPAAGAAMIHESSLVNGKSSMRPHERLRIGAGETVRLAPGGLHIMLQSLNRTLAAEDEVPLVLLLEGGATLEVIARVRLLGQE
ncbi:MAG TPA: copper chaperone PCu(A)C [Steroidobacteraceae bacterium]|jgi:copper(I)-binding protein|nr:copper chaperone PCu(A)C [Steroidobacteraceae bacterium]